MLRDSSATHHLVQEELTLTAELTAVWHSTLCERKPALAPGTPERACPTATSAVFCTLQTWLHLHPTTQVKGLVLMV